MKLGASVSLAFLIAALSAQGGSTEATVVVLGTGTPYITGERSGCSIGLLAGERLYVFDAGPGVATRIEQFRGGIRTFQVGQVFITHLHSDHTLGLPSLLYHHGLEPLAVFGPPGIKQMMEHIHAAWSRDREIRSQHPAVLQNPGAMGFVYSAQEVSQGHLFADGQVSVEAFIVPHGSWPEGHAVGYVATVGSVRVVISGDTHPSDAVVKACNGCDVLLHEAYSAEAGKKRPEEWQKYFGEAHTSTYELAELAIRAKPKLLVVYHHGYLWQPSDEQLIKEIRSRYSGEVAIAKDLDTFHFPPLDRTPHYLPPVSQRIAFKNSCAFLNDSSRRGIPSASSGSLLFRRPRTPSLVLPRHSVPHPAVRHRRQRGVCPQSSRAIPWNHLLSGFATSRPVHRSTWRRFPAASAWVVASIKVISGPRISDPRKYFSGPRRSILARAALMSANPPHPTKNDPVSMKCLRFWDCQR